MGALARLDDQVILRILSKLTASSLVHTSAACRALYCFANYEELWRALVLEVHFETEEIHCTRICHSCNIVFRDHLL